ncbi:hypothetical protein PRZ48_008247 [Zasmidium cellare]|uniref:FAD-binding PCMH-type domain-containing protein n=1 Tax=Zasmidium cellare TaxID=395010 RepID=A0ABR0EFQ3_ZASCE|nr:hypothetical protein PRZ48_008247 [Zasmidium cellare]
MPKTQELETLKSLLSSSEVLTKDDDAYHTESLVWAQQAYQNPTLVIRPNSLESLSKAVKFLAESSLDWQVKTGGAGGASATDVVLSTRAFNETRFVRGEEVVYLGAGALWGEYYEAMERVAPGWTGVVIGCRTPFIGVGGSILAGGFSWLSGDYGCTSDPDNMLDAQVVKLDGSVVWASEEPDLLWGLRGAQLGLGVVTNFKLRARPYSQQIYGGMILIPKGKPNEQRVAAGIATLDTGAPLPKVTMFLYTLTGMLASVLGGQGDDVLVLHIVDGNGEAHGREMFGWALEIPGAIDHTKVHNMQGLAKLQGGAVVNMGKVKAWTQAITMPRITEDIVLEAFRWHERVQARGGSSAGETYFLFELFSMRHHTGPSTESAWPRPRDSRHVFLTSACCAPDASQDEVDDTIKIGERALKEILGKDYKESYIDANALEAWNDLEAIYGENWKKVVKVKRKYDPEERLKSTPPLDWKEIERKLGI